MSVNTPKIIAGIVLPDSTISVQAADLLLTYGNEFLYNHSLRVFLFASLNAKRGKYTYDPELLYVSALFHDLGLTERYRSKDLRFEVDSANAARDFLESHGVPSKSLQLVWDAIALHTTIGIAEHKEAEVALLHSGVGLDVIGKGYENLSETNREEILAAFPRNDFKNKMIPAFFEGVKDKTETTFGNTQADVCAFMIPNFHKKNFCDCILHSPWKE